MEVKIECDCMRFIRDGMKLREDDSVEVDIFWNEVPTNCVVQLILLFFVPIYIFRSITPATPADIYRFEWISEFNESPIYNKKDFNLLDYL